MDVEAPPPRRLQDRPRQDQPIGRHHRHLGPECRKRRALRRLAKTCRTPHRQPQRLRPRLHRRRPRLLPAPAGPRRLGIGAKDRVPRRHQRVQRGHGELRRAHEDQPHGNPARRGSGPRLLLLQLPHPRGDHRPLHPAQVVDEEPAAQVVHLVLGADRPAVGELRLVRLAVEPQPAQPHPLRPGHLLVDLGDREAPLLAGLRLLRESTESRDLSAPSAAAARPCPRSP